MQQAARKITFWYGIFLSLFTVAMAVVFIAEAAQIYYAGEGYTQELVAHRLLILLAPILLWVLAIVGGFVLHVLFAEEGKLRAPRDARKTVSQLKKKLPAGEGEAHALLKKTELIRYAVWGAAFLFALGVAIYGIIYLADISNFPASDPTGSVLNLVRYMLSFVFASLLLFVFATVYDGFSAKKELVLVKGILAEGGGTPAPKTFKLQGALAAVSAKEEYIVLAARILVGVLAVVFIGLGVWNGGMADVFGKAAAICRECIGLG